jgi:hypothetical protein
MQFVRRMTVLRLGFHLAAHLAAGAALLWEYCSGAAALNASTKNARQIIRVRSLSNDGPSDPPPHRDPRPKFQSYFRSLLMDC